MTCFEYWSLVSTSVYNLLTFLLLVLVAYEAFVKPRLANVAFYLQTIAPDTKHWSWRMQIADFVLENRGVELRNLRISSDPDYLGWSNLGKNGPEPRKTSEYFGQTIPFLWKNERHQFLWCNMQANIDVVKKPFRIKIEFDNPALPFPRRINKTFDFNLSAFQSTFWGMAVRYDIHNVAQDIARIREELEKLSVHINRYFRKETTSVNTE